MNSQKKKVLIIDDEAGIVDELKDYLEEEDFEAEVALDGERGLSLLKTFHPDIVITDLKLPDISGLEILKQAKAEFPGMRVIVATGYVDQQLIDDAESLGRDSFIQKPFDLDLIKNEIDRLLG